MGTKVLRYQNQELIHYDQVLKGEAITLFNKKGTEVEQPPRDSGDANIRKNTILSRKYYLAALTDATKAVKMILPPG